MSEHILIVEAEQVLRDFLAQNFTSRGYTVTTASNGLEALAIFRIQPLDLIMLDIVIDHMDGFEVCRRIRQTSTVPILVLTALRDEADKVAAFDLGADDLLNKPFSMEELAARVRAMLRRMRWERIGREGQRILRYRELEIDTESLTVTCRGRRLHLTGTEFSLLEYLMRHPGVSLPYSDILETVWGKDQINRPQYLRVYIGRLRQKIEKNPEEPEYLHTEYGYGYRFGDLPSNN